MTGSDPTISVLLPVHAGVDPEHFATAVDSVLHQTRPADEIVVVEDGPLLPAHSKVLDDLEQRHAAVVRIALSENQGAGVANQTGLRVASGDWIAKVDADDINLEQRFATQLRAVSERSLDVCGAAIAEFEDIPSNVLGVRTNPRSHTDIAKRMRFNNPINHPSAFFRRKLALEAGGYPAMRFMQDYVLFARMLAHGAVMANLETPLIQFRAGAAVHRRRRGLQFARLEWQLQRELRVCGVIGRPRVLYNFITRMAYRLLPSAVLRFVPRSLLATGLRPSGGSHRPRGGES